MLYEKVGNIKVYVEENSQREVTVIFINGTDVIRKEVYFTNDKNKAVETLFMKMGTYTLEWLYINAPGLEKMTGNTYKSNNDYFCRIDNTRYFKHFKEPAAGWIKDKTGKRIIDN